MSSRKLQAGKTRGEDGRARETRRCCFVCEDKALAGDGGYGAVKEKVDENGCADVEGVLEAMVEERTDVVGAG